MNRVSFNLPTHELGSDLMTQEMFGYYDCGGIRMAVHIFRSCILTNVVWNIVIYSELYVFQDRLAKLELPGATELYKVMQEANKCVLDLVSVRKGSAA